jgi:hypothetical protein
MYSEAPHNASKTINTIWKGRQLLTLWEMSSVLFVLMDHLHILRQSLQAMFRTLQFVLFGTNDIVLEMLTEELNFKWWPVYMTVGYYHWVNTVDSFVIQIVLYICLAMLSMRSVLRVLIKI